MRLYNDFKDESNSSLKMACACIAAVSCIVLIFLGTIYMNKEQSKTPGQAAQTEAGIIEEAAGNNENSLISGSTLTAEDLDFWDMYPPEEEELTAAEKDKTRQDLLAEAKKRVEDKKNQESGGVSSNRTAKDADNETTEIGNEDSDKDKSSQDTAADKSNGSQNTDDKSVDGTGTSDTKDTLKGTKEQDPMQSPESEDGKHTLVKKYDSTWEWIPLIDTVPKHSYDFDKLLYEAPAMKYFENSRVVSRFGIDVSKYQGEIDWARVKAAGVDFAMIRVGTRGYSSGQLIMDENYIKNIDGAIKAGIKVGVYFFSQATSIYEAVEEANFVVASIAPYKITYPVVFDTERVRNDTSRAENLTSAQLTQYAQTFCDTVKAWGYQPMIYSDKEWLTMHLDLTKLKQYSFWLMDYSEKPDYPYKFAMWQYSNTGRIDGINGEVDLNISFVNYEEK